MTESVPSSTGYASNFSLESLRLDPLNPRIPESMRDDSTSELATILEMGFDAFAVAQSIVELGYFQAEPLIVIPHDSEPNAWVVAEGNRRLTALLGLANKEIRDGFSSPGRWNELAEKRPLSMDMEIPVVVHDSRDTTHAEVARAHVVGKLQWRPYMQAMFIAARVAEGRSLKEVADLIGITRSKAADLYRDQAVLRQAAELGLPTSQVETAFSVLTVAMGSTKVRNHVGAPLGSKLDPGEDPIPEDKHDELKEVITWVFGDEDHEPVISDSRQMSQLGNAIASDVGLTALRDGKTLEETKQLIAAAGMDPLTRLLKRLTAAKNALLGAGDDLSDHVTDLEVQNLVEDIEALTESLRSTVEELTATSGSGPTAEHE